MYTFREWWIFTEFIFGRGISLPNKIQRTVNLERTCVFFFFYYIVYLKVNLYLKWIDQFGESLPNFIFAVVNLDPIVLEKRWTDGESWPNDLVEKVNRGENLRWVGSSSLGSRRETFLTQNIRTCMCSFTLNPAFHHNSKIFSYNLALPLIYCWPTRLGKLLIRLKPLAIQSNANVLWKTEQPIGAQSVFLKNSIW